MQLYEVKLQSNFANAVELVHVIVCAQDQKTAKEMVIGLLEIPAVTVSVCEAVRIKPNLYLLERKPVEKPSHVQRPDPTPEQMEPTYQPSQKGLRAVAAQLAERREREHAAKIFAAQREWAEATGGGGLHDAIEYNCKILATVIAPDKETALRRMGRDLIRRGNNAEPTKDAFNVDIMLVDIVPLRRVA